MKIIAEKLIEMSELGLTDKASSHSYDRIYPQLLERFLDQEINILEVGVGNGGTLLALSHIFPKSTIYGLDYDYNLKIDIQNTNIILLPSMDQTDVRILDYVPNLDIILEDASHNYDKSMATFNLLQSKLNNNGLYVIEDIYPDYFELYKSDNRFTVYDLRMVKNRQDDVIACYNHYEI